MQEIYIESLGKVLKNKSKLEKELRVKITNKGKLFFINGNPENEYLSLKVLEAINLGFSLEKALLLKDEENILQILNIKEITKRNDLERVRSRIIGTHGKTIRNLTDLTGCEICLHDNQVGIIGNCEVIDEAIIGLTSIIHGSKQGNVYARLERQAKKRKIDSINKLNIKNELKKKN